MCSFFVFLGGQIHILGKIQDRAKMVATSDDLPSPQKHQGRLYLHRHVEHITGFLITVKLLLSGHLRDLSKCPLNRGCGGGGGQILAELQEH